MEEESVSWIRLNTGLRSAALMQYRAACGRMDTDNRSLSTTGGPSGLGPTAGKAPEQKSRAPWLLRCGSCVCHPFAGRMTAAGWRLEDVYCCFSAKFPDINFHFHFHRRDIYTLFSSQLCVSRFLFFFFCFITAQILLSDEL